jgi:hypothetical protein
MASIVENISGDKALQLGGEEFVRPLSCGNDWNKIRIGMRLAINGTSNLPAGAQRLAVGLCSGNQFTYQSSSCVSWAGISWGINGGGAWTYDGVNNWYGLYAGGSVSYVTAKVGATVTDTSTGNNSTRYISGTARSAPSIIMTELVRTSASSYTVRGLIADGGDIAQQPRFYDLVRSMEDEVVTGGYADTFVNILGTALASGLGSSLDTLSIYWNKLTPTIEINDICILRFY